MKQPRYSKQQVLTGSNVSVISENENGKLKIDVMIVKNGEEEGMLTASSLNVQAFDKSMKAIALQSLTPDRDQLIETHMAGTSIAHCILLADSDIDELECVDINYKGQQGRFFLESIDKNPQSPR